MKGKLFGISILVNLILLSMFGCKEKEAQNSKSAENSNNVLDTIYAIGGYYLLKDKNYNPKVAAEEFASQKNFVRSKVIDHTTAATMIKELTVLKRIYLTNYIDFDYEHIFAIIKAQSDNNIPDERRGIRVYYGAYTDGLLGTKHIKNKSHYSAIVLGTDDGKDLYDPGNINKFPIINYGNLCPPSCSISEEDGRIYLPDPAKALLFSEAGVKKAKNIAPKIIGKE